MQARANSEQAPSRDDERAKHVGRALQRVEAGLGQIPNDPTVDETFTKALRRLKKAAGLLGQNLTHPQAIQVTHHALAQALAIGEHMGDVDAKTRDGLDAFGRAQRSLYPVAQALGVPAPPPTPRRRADLGDDERREHRRVDMQVEVTFESETNFFQGFSEDISDGGLFIATYQLKPVGTEVEIEFQLPDGHVVSTTGTVRWHRDPRDLDPDVTPGMGLSFEDLNDKDRAEVREFIDCRAPLFYVD